MSVVKIPTAGIASTQMLTTGTIGIILLAAFIAHQATTAKPLLPLGVFRSRNHTGSNIIQAIRSVPAA